MPTHQNQTPASRNTPIHQYQTPARSSVPAHHHPSAATAIQETSSISHHAVNEILDCNIENLLNQSGDLAPSDMEATDQNAPCEQVPKLGMTFESEEATYNFYNLYARRVGFSIRKCHVKHRAEVHGLP
uniref:Uncharacterized protein n=1 Tax=Leersia perrieri TaxID=77586 RepID=A0A0D9WMZ8_9ORYZ